MAEVAPARADHAPMARARSSGWNVDERMARLPGTSMAAPTPWTARAATSRVMLGARPHRSEAAVKAAMPSRYTRRRPYWSPSEPPSSSRLERVTR